GDPSPEPVVEVQRDEVLPVGLGHDGAPFSPDPGPRRSRPMLCQAPGQQGFFLIGQLEISGRPYAVSLQRSPQMDGARRAGNRAGAQDGERETGLSEQAGSGDDGAARHEGGRVTRLGGARGPPQQLPGRGGRTRHLRPDPSSERPHRLRALPEGLAASPPGVRRPGGGPHPVDRLLHAVRAGGLARGVVPPAPVAHRRASPAGPLVPWSEWRVRAAEHGTPLARATVACLSSPAVDRGVDKRIYRSVTRWLDEEAEHSRALSVDGRQGSGRTWALLRSVERLSELRQTPVFVIDPAEELDTAALEEFRAARREPYIALVDTLDDEADARTVLGPLLAERRGRAPALYLLSGYEPPEWLERCEGVPVGRVTDEEVRQLSALLHSGRSRQRLSHNDRADLN